MVFIPSGHLEFLEVAALNALAIVMFRALPIVAWTSWRSERRVLRLGVPCAWVSAVAGLQTAGFSTDLWLVPFAYGYLALVALLAHEARQAHGRLVAAAVPLAMVCLLMVVPALVLHGSARGLLLILGWETVFCAISYHASRLPLQDSIAHDSTKDAVFFFTVDPSIEYPHRATSVQPAFTRGLFRVCFGAIVLMFGELLMSWDQAALRASTGSSSLSFTLLVGLAMYFTHSGLASVQIGLMRAAGYRVAERYNWPILARSPSDFWRRWNIWLGSWAKRHVFRPVCRATARASRGRKKLPAIIGTFSTFFVLGAMHDLFPWAMSGYPSTGPDCFMTIAFLGAGFITVAWSLVSRTRWIRAVAKRTRCFGPALSIALTLPTTLAFAWIAIPAIIGRTQPTAITAFAARVAALFS